MQKLINPNTELMKRTIHNLFSGLGELEYKCQWYGCELVVVDRFFPSSKTCFNCGHVQDMPLNVRTYDCPECGISIDRDLFAEHSVGNASINLRDAVSLTVNACGGPAADSSGGLRSIP